MNLIIIEPDDLVAENRAILSGRRLEHLTRVLDGAPGKRCKVGMLGGMTGCGTILSIGENRTELELDLSVPPPPPLPVRLVMALPRPKTLRKALHCAISCGVKELHFINSFKVEKSYWQSPFLNDDFLKAESILALEQAADTVLPEILFHPLFRPFVEDELSGIAAGSRLIAAHPGAAEPLRSGKAGELCTLLIGPEGGFTDFEIDLLKAQGCATASLGKRILRTEFALCKALALLETHSL